MDDGRRLGERYLSGRTLLPAVRRKGEPRDQGGRREVHHPRYVERHHKKRSAHVDDALYGAVYGRLLHDDRLCDVLYAVSLRRYQYVRHSGRRLRRGTAGGTDDLPAVFQKI